MSRGVNQGLKQRLVGTLVLLALVVILAPVLFNFDERPAVDSTSQVPPAPEVEPVIFSEPQRPDDIPERDDDVLFLPEAPESPEELAASGTTEIDPASGSLSSAGTPGSSPITAPDPATVPADAWVIQVGTFSQRTGADALLQRLIEDGYKAYRGSQFRSGTELHLIFVGPLLSRAEADRQKAAIEQQHGLDVVLRRFSP